MSTLLILNANIVEENRVIKSDLYIRGGRIEKIAKDLSAMKVSQVLDLKGKHLLPGMIDCHVQFPDDSPLGDLKSEPRAAVAGGITTVFNAFGNCSNSSPIKNNKKLKKKLKLASKNSITNYSFYLNATNDNLEEIKIVDPKVCCGLKVLMGGTRGDLLVDKEESLNSIFKASPVLVAAHCESTPIIVENEESYRQIYGDNIPMVLHPKIRSEEACYRSSLLAVKLAKNHSTRLHILHVSTAKEVELFTDDDLAAKLITSDVAVSYLDFSEEDYETKGSLIKCEPAIKSEVDRAGLFQGLMDGHLDSICSDHVSRSWDEKQGEYFEVRAGLPSVQYALLSILEHYQDGILSLQSLVEKTSHAVADIFQIKDRGYIREGYWADLVVVDLEKGVTVNRDDILSKSGWTPYEGVEFRSSIYATIVNGHLVFINNTVRSGANGKQVGFNR